ncbi:MAG TPA: Sip1-related alpha-galactosidase [Opitutaceae bacterium]
MSLSSYVAQPLAPSFSLDPIDFPALLARASAGVVYRDSVPLPAGADAAARLAIILPLWCEAVYHAPFQRHAINPALDLWPEGLNQCQPLPVRSLHDVKRGGLFLLLRLAGGGHLALLPLTGPAAMAWLRGDGAGLSLEVSHFGSEPLTAGLPLLAYAADADPYAACQRVWEVALAHPAMAGVGRLRRTKPASPVFNYIGWCSFEEYKLAIDEPSMVAALRGLAASPVPVRWALIDDGHVDDGELGTIETQEGTAPAAGADPATRRIRRAGTHPVRFPQGWMPLLETLRGSRLSWLGIWMNFNGYWGGVDPRGDWPADIRAALVHLDERTALSGADPAALERFWEHLLTPAAAGIHFLKVDNQAGNLKLYAGRVPNAVAASAAAKQALERVVRRHFGGQLINCMAHNGVGAFHTPVSAVTRCSEDYKCGDAWRAKHHLHNSFGNMLWLAPTVWGDHDMFHSSDPVAAGAMARSKALSGGPIYLSDSPGQFRPELIMPLCFADGRLLRPLAPAQPLPDSIFEDPYESGCAYRAGAPLPHGGAAIGCYNLAHPDRPVVGQIDPADLVSVRHMLGRGEAVTGAVVALDVRAGRAWRLSAREWFTLSAGEDALFVLSPVQHGWALLGAPDKYLAPAFVAEFTPELGRCCLAVPEPGRVWLWSATPVASAELPVRALGESLWEIEFTPGCLQGALHHDCRATRGAV